MIDILNRNTNFFKDLRNEKRIISAFDIDNQFASVIDYLNDVIVPAINDMQNEAFAGISGSPNYFLANVGDGSVAFKALDQVIPERTINLNKIEKVTPNGLLYIDSSIPSLLTGTNDNMLCTLDKLGSSPEFRFITSEYIQDRAITYADIADNAITKEHLHQEILDIIDAAVPDETVIEFGGFSITTDKFVANTINSFDKLGIIPVNSLYLQNVKAIDLKDGAITPDKCVDGSIYRRAILGIKKGKLAKNALTSTHFGKFFISTGPGPIPFPYQPLINYYKTELYRVLAADFRLPREKIGVIDSVYFFESKVQDAFRRFGIT